ncbi:VOC family protein [Nocardioides dongxiaopingii]|uniref:VOC family protein n=1 Tax=Nocardioides sp. S-1144 TaxID=2582905 RepID=UPI00110E795F|nr:VOC family protein [Nocardioides sp. S-1144]QCW51489.1 VOC family protein [Nocardioides sp. S-1144]
MTSTPATAVLKMTTLDCADVRAEAAFWSALLGWDVAHVQDEYAMLTDPTGASPALGLGQVPDHRPPSWPDEGGGKQFHLDLACDDVAATEERALGLGAALADPQPGETWRVLLDPAGHPFCLTDASRW